MSQGQGPGVSGVNQQQLSGLAGLVLPGWMDEQAFVRFIEKDCVSESASPCWRDFRQAVDELAPLTCDQASIIPMTDAEIKISRKFRTRYPAEHTVVDLVKLNPLDLIVHQHWISPAIAETYARSVKPDKWAQTALLDPPVASPGACQRDGNAIIFDLPHPEFLLAGPLGAEGALQVREPRAFVTVAFHAGRAVLVSGYHRAFALAKYFVDAENPPHGALFAVTNALDLLGRDADDVRELMEQRRPPRLGDFFDGRLSTPVTLKRRRYQLRIVYEVSEVEETQSSSAPATVQKPEGSPLPELVQMSAAVSRHASQMSAVSPRTGRSDTTANQAMFQQARRLQEAGQMEEALRLYDRLLELTSEKAAVLSNMATLLIEEKRFEEAEVRARQAIYADAGFASAHINLGVALETKGNFDEALQHYRQALAIEPENPAALNNIGAIATANGDIEDALKNFKRAIQLKPDYAEAYHRMAAIKSFAPGDEEVTAMAALAARKDLSERDAVYAHFALGKALDDVADYPGAFHAFQAGNQIKRRSVEFDDIASSRLFDWLTRSFDQDLLSRRSGSGSSSRAPIFIVGMPRSGTTLVEQILASHPEVHAAGELDHIPDLAMRAYSTSPGSETGIELTGDVLREYASGYLKLLPALQQGRTRFTDKMPANFLHLGLIHLMFPNASIIHTYRDPADTCLSCYFNLFGVGQAFSYDLGELGRYYNRYRDLMGYWRNVLPTASILDVRYESVVADLEGNVRRILEHCGLPWSDRCLDFHRTRRAVRTVSFAQVRKPIYSTSVERWRNYEAFLEPLMRELNVAYAVGG